MIDRLRVFAFAVLALVSASLAAATTCTIEGIDHWNFYNGFPGSYPSVQAAGEAWCNSFSDENCGTWAAEDNGGGSFLVKRYRLSDGAYLGYEALVPYTASNAQYTGGGLTIAAYGPYSNATSCPALSNAACEAIKARTQDPNDLNAYIASTSRNSYSGTDGATDQCVGGCSFGPDRTGAVGRVTTGSGVDAVTTSRWGFTGTACTPTLASPAPVTDATLATTKPTAQLCKVATGSQLTLCVRQDGQFCYAATTGKQICWRPAETGVKTSGNLAQKREPGTVAAPVAPSAPAGETLAQSGTPTPTTATTTTNTSSSTTNVTTTNTTTTNYTTTGGTEAGSTDSGVPASGSGGTAPPADAEGNGTVTAGTCEANYTCTGVSAVDCAILQETTKNRCATEANNPGKVMSAGEEAAATADGAGFTGTADSTGVTSETEYGADGLDDSGFLPGGRSCPTIPPMDILGQQFVMDTSAVCDWMTVGGYLVLLFGSIASLMILKGS